MDSNTDAHFPPYWSAMVMNAMPKIIPGFGLFGFFLPLYYIFYRKSDMCPFNSERSLSIQ